MSCPICRIPILRRSEDSHEGTGDFRWLEERIYEEYVGDRFSRYVLVRRSGTLYTDDTVSFTLESLPRAGTGWVDIS